MIIPSQVLYYLCAAAARKSRASQRVLTFPSPHFSDIIRNSLNKSEPSEGVTGKGKVAQDQDLNFLVPDDSGSDDDDSTRSDDSFPPIHQQVLEEDLD